MKKIPKKARKLETLNKKPEKEVNISFLEKFQPFINTVFIVASIILLIIFCYNNAVLKSVTADFFPINGDFQNFNPWRRLLDGQIPYKDFSVYLGSGHLLLGAFATFIFGGSFTDSIFAANFVSCLCGVAVVVLTAYLITRSYRLSLFIGVITTICYNIFKLKGVFYFLMDFDRLTMVYTLGHSGRMIRTFGIILFLILAFLTVFLLKKIVKPNKIYLIAFLIIAALAGMTISYSNDGGFAAYISASIFCLIYLVKKYKKDIISILKYVGIWIAVSLSAWFVISFIIGGGSLAYFEEIFGTAGYQYWYYGRDPKPGPFFVQDLFKISTIGAGALIFVVYQIIRFFNDKNDKPDLFRIAISYIVLAAFFHVEIYTIGAGGVNDDFIAIVIEIVIISYLSVLCRYAVRIPAKITDWLLNGVGLVFVAVVFIMYASTASAENKKQNRQYFTNPHVKEFVKELGGSLTQFNKNELYALSNEIGDESFFSTYATAFEVIKGKYQPTGYDYIIHVMGARQRADYKDNFLSNEYNHVLNPTFSVSPWMGWLRQANWYFFRELYSKYDLKTEISYLEHWVKSEDANLLSSNTNIAVYNTDSGGIKIICTAEKPITAIADVFLSYNISSNGKKSGMFRKILFVQNPTFFNLVPLLYTNYNLLDSAENLAIPITIVDGYGEIVLTPYPLGFTQLNLTNVKVNKVIKEPYNPINDDGTMKVLNYSNNFWYKGVARGDNVLLFVNTAGTRDKLINNSPSSVSVETENGIYTAKIEEVQIRGEVIYIYIERESTADKYKFSYPAKLIVNPKEFANEEKNEKDNK